MKLFPILPFFILLIFIYSMSTSTLGNKGYAPGNQGNDKKISQISPKHIKLKDVKRYPRKSPAEAGKDPKYKYLHPQGTSCPFLVSGRRTSKYGIKINILWRSRKSLQLASAMMHKFEQQGRNRQIIYALYHASLQTGVDFELLVIKAMMESSLGRNNIASGSSARGAFQYIETTWLNLMKRYGDKIGYHDLADSIVPDKNNPNYFTVADSVTKNKILNLRFDPYISALLKSYQIKEEGRKIRRFNHTNRVGITDHYIVHMLGINLSKIFFTLKNRKSKVPLAYIKNGDMDKAIKTNRFFFYSKDGRALTAAQSYKKFAQRVADSRKYLQKILKEYNVNQGCGRYKAVPPYSGVTMEENDKSNKSNAARTSGKEDLPKIIQTKKNEEKSLLFSFPKIMDTDDSAHN